MFELDLAWMKDRVCHDPNEGSGSRKKAKLIDRSKPGSFPGQQIDDLLSQIFGMVANALD